MEGFLYLASMGEDLFAMMEDWMALNGSVSPLAPSCITTANPFSLAPLKSFSSADCCDDTAVAPEKSHQVS